MNKVYYLSTCDTCKRIIKEVGIDDSFELQDIKFKPATEEQIESMYQETRSYEALINKRARKLKTELESNPIKSDDDYKNLLLKDYTFLKRPIFNIENEFFIGNAKATIASIKLKLSR